MPILHEIQAKESPSHIDQLAGSTADLYVKYSDFLDGFVNVVEGGYEVSLNEGFMTDLKEKNRLLYDSVLNLKLMRTGPQKIRIDSKVNRFFRLYNDEILEGMKIEDSDLEEIESYASLLRRIRPSFKKSSVRRTTRRNLTMALRRLQKVHKQVDISKGTVKNLGGYVLPELRPFVVLMEEYGFLEISEKQSEKSR